MWSAALACVLVIALFIGFAPSPLARDVAEASARASDDAPNQDSFSLLAPADEFLLLDGSSSSSVATEPSELPSDAAPICLPKACLVPKHFLSQKTMRRAQEDAFTILASTPGSGNTWVRSVVEEGTRVFTGSVYHDADLKNDYGFEGEMINPWTWHPTMSVIKSHWPLYLSQGVPQRVTGAIYIMRAPWDALLSEFNREFSTAFADSHVAHAPKDAVLRELAPWANRRHQRWVDSARFWSGGFYWPNLTDASAAVQVQQPMRPPSDHVVPVLVLFYEDFVRDFADASRQLFGFLKERLGDAMPSVDDAVACAVYGRSRELAAKRHSTSRRPYNPWQDRRVRVHTARYCDRFAPFWVERKWGVCAEARLQVERNVTVRAPPVFTSCTRLL